MANDDDELTELAAAARDALADVLRGARATARLSQEVAAARAGISKSTVVRVEKPDRAIDLDQLAALAAAYDVTPAELLLAAEGRQAFSAALTSARKAATEGRPFDKRRTEGSPGRVNRPRKVTDAMIDNRLLQAPKSAGESPNAKPRPRRNAPRRVARGE